MDRFEDAFPALFTRSYHAAARIVRTPADAEDIAAEALSRAYLAWRKLSDADHQTAWVLRVTVNLAIDSIRRQRPAPPAVDGPHAEDAADLRATIHPLLRRLPRRQREVVVLRHLLDLSDAETAAVLGISAGAVKQHLHRAMGRLRELASTELTEAIA